VRVRVRVRDALRGCVWSEVEAGRSCRVRPYYLSQEKLYRDNASDTEKLLHVTDP
jgi:hypothetical protein